jgi:NitT/TauT family transport system ATP-binding protein
VDQQTDDVTVRLRDVEVEFPVPGSDTETHKAVTNFNLDIRRGELVVLIGRSGCGKTTVLNLVSGLYKPTRGEVAVLGKTPEEGLKHVGYMFARDALLPWRTASQNIEFALELRRPDIGRKERKERARQWLETLGVGRAVKLWPWQLSQGMRQRVALARTWAIDPDVLLMDEPFAALDAQTRIDVHETFLETWSQNRKTVMFVTHDLNEAILLADRVVCMYAGRTVDIVPIDLPRPRDPLTLVEEPHFRDLHQRLVYALTHGERAPQAIEAPPVPSFH